MRIGLTGGIGCGKSTAGAFMEKAGLRRMDSDAIVRELLASDSEVIRAVSEHFGPEMIAAEGGIDRSRLAAVVFKDNQALTWLEEQLHPRVGVVWRAALAGTPDQNWVVEIPLLFEKNLEKHFDMTVCVACSENLQLQRLARKNISVDQAKARMARQMPLPEKVSKSDFVLYNNGSISFLERQIVMLLDFLLKNRTA